MLWVSWWSERFASQIVLHEDGHWLPLCNLRPGVGLSCWRSWLSWFLNDLTPSALYCSCARAWICTKNKGLGGDELSASLFYNENLLLIWGSGEVRGGSLLFSQNENVKKKEKKATCTNEHLLSMFTSTCYTFLTSFSTSELAAAMKAAQITRWPLPQDWWGRAADWFLYRPKQWFPAPLLKFVMETWNTLQMQFNAH